MTTTDKSWAQIVILVRKCLNSNGWWWWTAQQVYTHKYAVQFCITCCTAVTD